MSEPFLTGERVKLADRYATALCKRPKNRTDWRARRGTVKHRPDKDSAVAVLWDGCKVAEWIPARGVERAGNADVLAGV